MPKCLGFRRVLFRSRPPAARQETPRRSRSSRHERRRSPPVGRSAGCDLEVARLGSNLPRPIETRVIRARQLLIATVAAVATIASVAPQEASALHKASWVVAENAKPG